MSFAMAVAIVFFNDSGSGGGIANNRGDSISYNRGNGVSNNGGKGLTMMIQGLLLLQFSNNGGNRV